MSKVLTPWAIGSDLVRRQSTYTKDDFIRARVVVRTLFLLALLAVLSLVTIWSRVQVVQYGYDINRLISNQQVYLENNKKLKTEVATLRSPERLEKTAREKLGMQTPAEGQILQLKSN